MKVNSNLLAAVEKLNKKREVYDKEFMLWWADLEILPKDDAWQVMEVFQRDVLYFLLRLKRSNGIVIAAQELMRRAGIGETCRVGQTIYRYDLDDVIRFAKFYEQVAIDLGHHLQLGGCDSEIDLVDCLPLAGKDMVKNMYAAEQSSVIQTQLSSWVQEGLKAAAKRCEFPESKLSAFFPGEHYIAMSLRDAVKDVLLWADLEPLLFERPQFI